MEKPTLIHDFELNSCNFPYIFLPYIAEIAWAFEVCITNNFAYNSFDNKESKNYLIKFMIIEKKWMPLSLYHILSFLSVTDVFHNFMNRFQTVYFVFDIDSNFEDTCWQSRIQKNIHAVWISSILQQFITNVIIRCHKFKKCNSIQRNFNLYFYAFCGSNPSLYHEILF